MPWMPPMSADLLNEIERLRTTISTERGVPPDAMWRPVAPYSDQIIARWELLGPRGRVLAAIRRVRGIPTTWQIARATTKQGFNHHCAVWTGVYLTAYDAMTALTADQGKEDNDV